MADEATPLLRTAAIRRLEAAASESASLMELAGAAVARRAVTMTLDTPGAILVLAGPGNNGGDGLVAARRLAERGIAVRVALLDDPSRYSGSAAAAWSAWQAWSESQAQANEPPRDPIALLAGATLVVDGLFGIGADRPPTGPAREWIERVNATNVPVLAIDVPSGVAADTGHVGGVAIVSDRTLTFIADKPGLRTGDAVDHVGVVEVDTLGVMVDRADGDAGDVGFVNAPTLFAPVFAARRINSHKGNNGSVAVIGGDHGMVGGALLAARMALHAGAGRVYVRLLADDAPDCDLVQPELMLRVGRDASLEAVDAGAWAVGPGLGHGDVAIALLRDAIGHAKTLVLDADALNLIAKDPTLAAGLTHRVDEGLAPAVLTPHPLEAARLLGGDAATVQRDRIAAATTLARRHASVVVVKGAGTVVAHPDGRWVVNTTGNPSLGTGGTGDVLCGLVGGLLAQHPEPWQAACAAVWLHGCAADDLVAAGIGPVGLCASELIPAIRTAINRGTGGAAATRGRRD